MIKIRSLEPDSSPAVEMLEVAAKVVAAMRFSS